MKSRLTRYAPMLVYTLLSLAILAPLLAPGFIITIDMVFVPHPPMPSELSNDFLFRAVLHWLSFVLPADVLQKIVLFLLLFLSGLGAYRLCNYLLPKQESVHQWAAYIAGIFYLFNPFVYGRFMAGQYVILLGYALLPFFINALLKFVQHPSRRSIIAPTLWLALISIISIHILGLALVAALVILLVHLWRYRKNTEHFRRFATYGLLGSGAFLLLNSYWLIPLLTGKSALQNAISQFGPLDFQAFASDGGILSIFQLKGFWLEAQHLFMAAGEPLPLSGIWQLLLWLLLISGAVAVWKHQKYTAATWSIIAVIALCFAVDSPLSQWLVGHLPGYREPHKFTALLALSSTIFIAFGTSYVLSRLKRALPLSAACIALLPILTTPAMLWGCYGQLQPTHYPQSWYELNETLPNSSKVLFLPWHMYMKFSFTERVIANPADAFFDATIITSQDPEFAGSRTPRENEEATMIAQHISSDKTKNDKLLGQLRALNITHVLLAKENDWRNYDYLEGQKGITLSKETDAFKLYAIKEREDE